MSQTSYCINSELAFNITQLDTYKVLASSSNSAAGPDGISGTVLRKLAHVLALPLSIVFQQSVSHNTFPSAWKKVIVVPIYKGKGSKSSASSYRPINLCSTIGKALELIIRDQIMAVVQNTKPQCTVQHVDSLAAAPPSLIYSVLRTSWRMPIIEKRARTLLHSTFLVRSTAFRTTYYLTNLQHMALLAPLSNGCKASSLVARKLCV